MSFHGFGRRARAGGSMCLPLVAAVLLTACQPQGALDSTSASSMRPATKAEIQEIAVGRTINGAMTYNADGSYLYNGANPGRYRISDGQICVDFRSGGRRCDRIVTSDNGETFMLINSDGEGFPFG